MLPLLPSGANSVSWSCGTINPLPGCAPTPKTTSPLVYSGHLCYEHQLPFIGEAEAVGLKLSKSAIMPILATKATSFRQQKETNDIDV